QEMGPMLEAQKAGAQGYVLVDFIYQGGGKASGIHSSGSHDDRMDKAGVYAVEHAIFPRKPDSMAGIDHYVIQIALTGANPEVSTVTRGPNNKVSFVTGSGPLPPKAPAPEPAVPTDNAVTAFE